MSTSIPADLPPISLLKALSTLRRKPRGLQVPLQRQFNLAPADPSHIERYRQYIGFHSPNNAPTSVKEPLSYHYLAMQRAHLAIMLDTRFIYPVAGMVHVENVMQYVNHYAPNLPSQITAWVDAQTFEPGENQYVTAHGTLEQNGRTIVQCKSRYLAKRGCIKSAKAATSQVPPEQMTWQLIKSWTLDEGSGRRFAAISGDSNPIHLWRWSAKLLGFARPIIHGMDSVARSEAVLACNFDRANSAPWQISVRFSKPILLPAQVNLHCQDQQFAVIVDGSLRLSGEIGPCNQTS